MYSFADESVPKMHWIRRFRYARLMALISGILLLTFASYALFSNSTNQRQPEKQEYTKNASVKILVWTKVFLNPPNFNENCFTQNPCIFTTNRSEYDSADAVVFHGHDIVVNDLPDHAPTNQMQKNVFYSMESAPSLNLISGGSFWKNYLTFHWVLGYMNKAHAKHPYYGYLVNPEVGKKRGFRPVGNFNKDQVMATKKVKGAIWFVSNCDSKERLQVANALKRHFRVDIGGKCSNNKDLCPRDRDCNPLVSQYYFKLVFENSNCKDYVTEKFYDLLPLPIVPIVMKRSVYEGVVPPESFIAVDDFPSAEKLAEHLNYLIENPDEYFKLIEWRNRWTQADWNSEGYRLGFCDLCEKLKDEYGVKSAPIDGLKQWYAENSRCEQAVDQSWYN